MSNSSRMQTRRAARLHADSEGSISLENIYDERKFREKAANWIGTCFATAKWTRKDNCCGLPAPALCAQRRDSAPLAAAAGALTVIF